MARPRVFVSSTFYDLRQVRTDMERFITEMGYEPVLHEKGHVPYGKGKKLEDHCYREIESCDILVSIIGGRYGTSSHTPPYSISQMELKRALESDKQVFIFVERAVHSEFATYLKNKEHADIQYYSVDNVAVFKFLEEVEKLPRNNPTTSFENAQQITGYLKEQWAGLFQRFLQDQGRLRELDVVEQLSASAKTLDQLVTYLTEERKNKDSAIHEILLSNHPAFERLRSATKTTYRVFFTTRDEMATWLKARNFTVVEREQWDDAKHEEYLRNMEDSTYQLLRIRTIIFDKEGKLKPYTKDDWRDDWIRLEVREHESSESPDDIPF